MNLKQRLARELIYRIRRNQNGNRNTHLKTRCVLQFVEKVYFYNIEQILYPLTALPRGRAILSATAPDQARMLAVKPQSHCTVVAQMADDLRGLRPATPFS